MNLKKNKKRKRLLKAGTDPSMIGQSAPKARPSLGVFDRIDPDDDLISSSGNLLSLVHLFGATNTARRSGHLKHLWPL